VGGRIDAWLICVFGKDVEEGRKMREGNRESYRVWKRLCVMDV